MKGMKDFARFMPKLYGTVTMGGKGQIVIPKDVREQMCLQEGDQLLVMIKHNKAIGLIKATDLQEMVSMMQKEMGEFRQSTRGK